MKYENVPNIISGKDLDYLSDMFNWNFNAFKLINDFKETFRHSSRQKRGRYIRA